MKEEWQKKRLDEMGTISRGRSKHRPRNDPDLFGGDYPFIQTADVKDANLYITNYSQTYNEKGLAQSKLWQPGTLCITIAANIADTGILGIPACFPDSVMGFVPFDDVSDVKFVKYLFNILQKECQSISKGTAQDNLSWEKLSQIKFPCPDIKIQRKIVSILSAYDDLIENNNKQIKLLEEAAQKLYKEWFVKLNFPGHENTTIVDGVPEGWHIGNVGEIGNFKRGKVITKARTQPGNIPVIAGGIEPAYYHSTANTLCPVITVSASGNAGFVKMYYCEVWASDCSYLDSNSTDNLYFVYTVLKSKQEYLYSLQKGACQKHVNATEINNLEILIPTNNLIIKFNELLKTYFENIRVLQNQNKDLQASRDKLLPKLMNQEIEVTA